MYIYIYIYIYIYVYIYQQNIIKKNNHRLQETLTKDIKIFLKKKMKKNQQHGC